MKKYAIVSLFVIALVGCAPSDLSTDENAMKFYCYETDMVYEEAKDWICVERVDQHEDIIIIGAFAHDRGCMLRSLIVNKEVGDWTEMIPAAVEEMGWSIEAKREDILMKLIHELSMGWGGVMDQPSKEFEMGPLNKFFAPNVTKLEDGYSADFWVLEPGGMLPQNVYSLYHVEFSSTGEMNSAELTDGFTVDLK